MENGTVGMSSLGGTRELTTSPEIRLTVSIITAETGAFIELHVGEDGAKRASL